MMNLEKNKHKIAVLGGDNRQLLLYNKLSNKDFDIILTAYDTTVDINKIKSAEIMILPTVVSKDGVNLNAPNYSKSIDLNDIIKNSDNCKYVICGKISENIKNKFKANGVNVFEYTNDENFKILNGVSTAEGAVSIAISKTKRTICGSNCLIIGNGCIGKSLTKILVGMGANVTVSARKEKDFNMLWADNINSLNSTKLQDADLNRYDIIFNTVPHSLISEKNLYDLNCVELIIDLASIPYGFKHENKDTYPFELILAPSLPAIYAPLTSTDATAKTIENYILEVIKDEQD